MRLAKYGPVFVFTTLAACGVLLYAVFIFSQFYNEPWLADLLGGQSWFMRLAVTSGSVRLLAAALRAILDD